MRKMTMLAAVLLAAALAACSSSSSSTPSEQGGFTQPAGTVAVNFTVDDTANHVYGNGDLEWKGAISYVTTTRKVTADPTWAGPFPRLYDDGPWTAGGHEPVGAVAGDHRLGVTVFVTPPAAGTDTYEYGLNDVAYAALGNGWVWRGANGTFQVAAGATTAVTALGMTFPAFGNNDLKLVLDPATIGSPENFDTSVVKVKGSATAWVPVTLTTTVANPTTYVFTLSEQVGAGHTFSHSGLLLSADRPEFIYVFGTGDGKEYKDASGWARMEGIAASYKAGAGAWTPVTVTTIANQNTAVTIP